MKTIKTYITTDNTSRLSLELKVKGKYRRVEFSNGGLSMNGAATFGTVRIICFKTFYNNYINGKASF